jgi:hypothetical protein
VSTVFIYQYLKGRRQQLVFSFFIKYQDLYDKEKYRELILDAAETVLGYFGFDKTIYGKNKNTTTRKWNWLQDLKQEREKDIRIETMEKQ